MKNNDNNSNKSRKSAKYSTVHYTTEDNQQRFERENFYPGDIPQSPGIYIFRDRFSKVIYVGKAANLRKRMSSYFQPSRSQTADPKLRSLINSICFWEYHTVKNEAESLILEARTIKDYSPRYNVLLRDDKRFLLVKIDLRNNFPTLYLARLRKNDGARYFGPFPQSGALRKTIDFLVKRFQLRVCKAAVPSEKERKHCLASIVKDCCEPCAGKVTKDEYMERVEELMGILNGNVSSLVSDLREKMNDAVEKRRFENAALFRDMIENIEEIFGNRNRSFRFAKIAGVADGIEAITALGDILGLPDPPRRIEAFDISNISGSLAVASMVCFIDGKPDTSQYRRFRMKAEIKKEGTSNKKDDSLSLPAIPDYTYGYGGDDFAMMNEVITRRYGKLAAEHPGNLNQKELKTPKFPELILIDGGKGQLKSAMQALKTIGYPFVPIIGLAKKNEEIFIPGRQLPILVEKRSPALKLLQALRDEAHRFAVAYHRNLRDSRIEDSILDQIEGIGPERKRTILKTFGSVKKLRKATPEQITEKIPGIGAKLAETIARSLKKKL
jgi:excinuclease ABC subunit C